VKSSRTLTRFRVFSLRAWSFRAPSTARGLALRWVDVAPPAEDVPGEPAITTTEPSAGAGVGLPPGVDFPALDPVAERTAEGALAPEDGVGVAMVGVVTVGGTLGGAGAEVGTEGTLGAGGGAGRGAGAGLGTDGTGTVGVGGGAGTGVGAGGSVGVGGGGAGTGTVGVVTVGVGGTGTGAVTVGVGGTVTVTVGSGGTWALPA
jgi:hypothetical protein